MPHLTDSQTFKKYSVKMLVKWSFWTVIHVYDDELNDQFINSLQK